jgi:hypothetical protein
MAPETLLPQRCRLADGSTAVQSRRLPGEDPMTISMYQASVPLMTKMLINLKAILLKAIAHAKAKKIEDSALLNARLYPDMFVLTRQVQIACDFGRATAARLAGLEPPAYEENEQSLAELVSRIDRSVDYLQSLKPQQIDGSETREIVRPVRGEPHKFTGTNYLFQFALPNFFFHVTTAYAILRHNGIEIGKYDYIGALD